METTTSDKTIVVNARLDGSLVTQLDELAEAMERTRSYLIAQAVREFVEREYGHLLAVREGEADIDAGRHLSGSEVRAWLDRVARGARHPRGQK